LSLSAVEKRGLSPAVFEGPWDRLSQPRTRDSGAGRDEALIERLRCPHREDGRQERDLDQAVGRVAPWLRLQRESVPQPEHTTTAGQQSCAKRTGGSSTMHHAHMDWSAVVTALAVLGIITFLFLY